MLRKVKKTMQMLLSKLLLVIFLLQSLELSGNLQYVPV